MIEITWFDPQHCAGARAHASQVEYQHMLDDPSGFQVAWPETYSALDDGELIAIGGTVSVDGSEGGWVLFTDRITPARFVVVHKAALREIAGFDKSGTPVFAHINPDNPQALRWADMLGLVAQGFDEMPDGRRLIRTESHARIS